MWKGCRARVIWPSVLQDKDVVVEVTRRRVCSVKPINSSLHDKPGRRRNRACFRVVVVLNQRGGRLRAQSESRTKLEIEFRPAGARPEVNDHTVGQDVVLANVRIERQNGKRSHLRLMVAS